MLSVEELLDKYIGSGGKWQRIQISLIWLQSLAYGICYLLYIFVAYAPPYRCVIPQCETKVTLGFATVVPLSVPALIIVQYDRLLLILLSRKIPLLPSFSPSLPYLIIRDCGMVTY